VEISRWIATLIFSTLFGIPAFVIHVAFYYTHSTQVVIPGLSVANLVLFLLATVVQVCLCVHALHMHSNVFGAVCMYSIYVCECTPLSYA